MRRLKCEKETIILTNEDDGFYDVYTFNQSLQKRLRAFAEKYPDDCWLKGSSEDGSETYMIRKGRLSLKLVPPYIALQENAGKGYQQDERTIIGCDLREKCHV
ncbi:MAG: molecular chaperone [Mediterraneibacter gnavus]